MTDIIQKWDTEFNISDPAKEPLLFLLCKNVKDDLNKSKNDHIIDERNQLEINKRVTEKTSELEDELDEIKEENSELEHKCNSLYGDNASLKTSRSEDIENAVSDAKENKDEIIQVLREEKDETIKVLREEKDETIQVLREERDVLKYEKETIFTDFLKANENQNKSSYEMGVEGEMSILSILQSGGWDEVIDTHEKDNRGDVILKYNNKKFIIDVKNYSSDVPAREVRKLAKDIEENRCDGGAIISLKQGILDPTMGGLAKEVIYHVCVQGKSILLLSNASTLSPEFINASLKLLESNFSMNSENNGQINDKFKEEITKCIVTMEHEISTETIKFKRMITKKRNNLDQLKNTLEEIIGPMDDVFDEPSSDQPIKLTIQIMKQKLIESGISIDGLKGKTQYRDKYNEVFSEKLSP